MSPDEIMQQLASCNIVAVFSMGDCCMSIVVKYLLFSLNVGPKVVELDDHVDGPHIQDVLCQVSGYNEAILAVFIWGKFLSGVESLQAYHVNRKLVPHLKEVGALWL